MSEEYLSHHGVLGMKWGVRRYQPYGGGTYEPEHRGRFVGKNGSKDAGVKRSVSQGDPRGSIATRRDRNKQYRRKVDDARRVYNASVKTSGRSVDTAKAVRDKAIRDAKAEREQAKADVSARKKADKEYSKATDLLRKRAYEESFADLSGDQKEKSNFKDKNKNRLAVEDKIRSELKGRTNLKDKKVQEIGDKYRDAWVDATLKDLNLSNTYGNRRAAQDQYALNSGPEYKTLKQERESVRTQRIVDKYGSVKAYELKASKAGVAIAGGAAIASGLYLAYDIAKQI